MSFQFDSGIFSIDGLSGEILPGAALAWYASGTSTPLATYSDPNLTVPNANPILCAADGRVPPVWLQDRSYKLVMTLPNGTVVTRDPIRNPGTGVFSSIADLASPAAGKGDNLTTFVQRGDGATPRTTREKAQEAITPDDYGAVGDGVTDDTLAIARARAAAGSGGSVFLPTGKLYRATEVGDSLGVGYDGPGVISRDTGSSAYSLRPYPRREGYVHGREYLTRLFARIGSLGTTLTGFIDGDSTAARGNTTVVAGVAANVMTVSNAGTATLAPGTYVTGISPTCRIILQASGTPFGNGVYQISESTTLAPGTTIAVGNGGGFAGDRGEPQALLSSHFRTNGARNAISLVNLAIGSSTWQDLVSRDRAQYLTAATDIIVVKAPVNRQGSLLNIAPDIASMRQYFSDLRAATYGSVNLLAIVLVGLSPAFDQTNGRTSLYAQLMREAYLQCVDDFKLVFIDLHGFYSDGSQMVGNTLDSVGVHPNGFLQQQLWNKIGLAILDAGDTQLSTGNEWFTCAGANSWTSYGNGYAPPQVSLSADGWVRLRGAIARSSGTPTAGQKMLDLPNSNYFPPFSISVPATTFDGAAWSGTHLGIAVDGGISPRDDSARNAFVSLDGIAWRAW